MGREAQGTLPDGTSVSLHLDAADLTVRGTGRWVAPRVTVTAARADGDLLAVHAPTFPGGVLEVRLGRGAARWAEAITAPPPDLAAKLGIAADTRVAVVGDPPPEIAAVLAGRVVPDDADVLVATVRDLDDLAGLVEALLPGSPPIWVVHGKGRSSAPGADVVRSAMRAAGLRDVKVSGVADLWTATRYTWPPVRG